MAYGANAYKGKWKPRNPLKYKGDIHNITYRSSWELKFMNYCDQRSNVLAWSSEETIIPYISPIDGIAHRYFVDFKMTIRNLDGTVTTYLVEVKPEKYTKEPKKPKRQSKKYFDEAIMWCTNQAKWEAAKKYCDRKGYKFIILTEKHLGVNK